MEIENEANYKNLTVQHLSELIVANKACAIKFNLKFERTNGKGIMSLRIVEEGKIVYEQTYNEPFIHEMIAHLHSDAAHFFKMHAHKLKMAARKSEEKQMANLAQHLKKTMYEQAHPDYESDDAREQP